MLDLLDLTPPPSSRRDVQCGPILSWILHGYLYTQYIHKYACICVYIYIYTYIHSMCRISIYKYVYSNTYVAYIYSFQPPFWHSFGLFFWLGEAVFLKIHSQPNPHWHHVFFRCTSPKSSPASLWRLVLSSPSCCKPPEQDQGSSKGFSPSYRGWRTK